MSLNSQKETRKSNKWKKKWKTLRHKKCKRQKRKCKNKKRNFNKKNSKNLRKLKERSKQKDLATDQILVKHLQSLWKIIHLLSRVLDIQNLLLLLEALKICHLQQGMLINNQTVVRKRNQWELNLPKKQERTSLKPWESQVERSQRLVKWCLLSTLKLFQSTFKLKMRNHNREGNQWLTKTKSQLI